MQTVIIVVHLMIVIALVGVVLVQKSEGGGLGIGGGSGFMTARGAANMLTRTTGILAALFFITSLALSLLARYGSQPLDILDQAPQQTHGTSSSAPAGKGVLDQLNGKAGSTSAPTGTAPATPPASSSNVPTQGSATPPASTQTPAAPAPATTPAPSTGGTQQPQVPNK